MNQIMYIGPDVKGVVKRNQIFTYDPKEVKEKVKKMYEPAGGLFVKMEFAPVQRKSVCTEGTLLNITYNNFARKLAE